MSDELDDLFEDAADHQQQQEQEQEQQQQVEDGMEEMEDEPAAAPDADGLAEADLFGSDDGELGGGPAAAAADEATGAPINVSAPLLQRPPTGKLLLLKVPNLIKLDSLPYDPEATDLEPEEINDRGNRRFRPNDINVIRWRFRQNPDGTLSRESNARYVQWSDGTESIMLGDEVLTMDRQQEARANTYVHVVRYDAIQGLAHIKQTVHLKPVSLDSKLHQRLKMTVQKGVRKEDKVQVHLAARNPEVEKAEAEKRAEEMAKLRRSQARVERTRVPKQRPPAFTAAYIEDDEDEGDAYYNGAGGGGAGGGGRGRDDADDYYRRPRDDEEAAARLQSAKRSTPPPTSIRSAKQQRVEQQPAEEEEVEEMQEAAKAAPGLKVRRGAILDDEDDD